MKELFYNVCQTFVSNTITELSYRLMQHQKIITRISGLVPLHVVSAKFNELKEVIEFYLDDLPSNDMIVIEAEIDLCRLYWSSRSATTERLLLNKFSNEHIICRHFIRISGHYSNFLLRCL